MKPRAITAGRLLLWLGALLPRAVAADDLRFEIPSLPGFQKYVHLAEHPGYIGVLLENNDLHPTRSSKMIVRDGGREVEAKLAVMRFTGREAAVYSYEAGVSLGIGKAAITFPVIVDLSALAAGKAVVVAKLPLATLLTDDKRERIYAKASMLANVAAQQKLLDYLDRLAKNAPPGDARAINEAILLDAFNRGGPAAGPGSDVGDAVPISEQWMLLVTLAIWLILVPIGLLIYRLRRRRARPAVR